MWSTRMRNAMLVGERVYLRPVEPDDGNLMAEFGAQENETVTHMGGRIAYSPIAARDAIERAYSSLPPVTIDFAVCLLEDDSCIGFVGVTGIDWIHGHGETFSSFGPGEIRGKGYGTEAKHLLLEYAFDHIGLHVLTSWVWELNRRSLGALAKQGYRPAGRLKFDGIEQGVYYDDMVFDVLRDDWVAARDAWRESRSQQG
jgi:RimJ/RimL family protein N-acetyltransferase